MHDRVIPHTKFLLLALILAVPAAAAQKSVDWPAYNGGVDGDHYSRLTQINRSNVHRLQIAWRFDTGETGQIQTNPLIIGSTLYAYTPTQKVIALNAATGKLRWKFDSGIPASQPARGLSYLAEGSGRLYAGIMNFLYCLDAATGQPIASFGEQGRIDLRKNLDRDDWEAQSIALTSPGVIYKDVIIVGGRNPETHPSPPGYIRAYDVHTGALRWTFHTIPLPGEPGYETWPKDAWKTAGAANNWPGMTLDEKRGIVYVPTGSAVMDFYGGDRIGDDLFANCLLALDASTGKLLWYFQGVHHDIWDRDFPSAPALFTIERNGKPIDALAQTSKQGYLYLFDRVTGKPLYPLDEKTYPPSTVPGEVASTRQSLPTWPQPFSSRQALTINDLTNRTPAAHDWALKAFEDIRSNGQFYPMSLDKLTVVFPGFDGGAEWGGPAIDPVHKILYVNENEMAWLGGLIPEAKGGTPGEQAYREQCAVCHGVDRTGAPPAFPTLIDITTRLTKEKIIDTIHHGNGRMPAFPNIEDARLTSLLEFLRSPAPAGAGKELASHPAAPTVNDAKGSAIYQDRCAICHGDHQEGIAPSFPALAGVGARMKPDQITQLIHSGKSRMPPMPDIAGEDLRSLLRFLGAESNPQPSNPNEPPQYLFTGYRKFLDPDGYPAIAPPWGTLNAIDLKTGKALWKIPFGEYPDLVAQGLQHTGSENYGGPIATASGLLFIGSTVYDRKFHAFDARTGKLLWQYQLPFAGMATPSTYAVGNRQYVVTVASGGRDPKSPTGGAYIAFALPRKSVEKSR